MAAIGCALFIPAASYRVYALFLGALFVLASGVTILQVAANPYVTILGKPETAASRLTLTQAFNSLGTTVAPVFGAVLILSAATDATVNAEADAAHHVAYFWGGAMVGRFIGSAAMRYIDDGKALAFNAFVAIILLFITVATTGHIAMWSVLAIGLFNSIMFPTIFSLALHGLGSHTSQGSGILCLAIVGGAIVPLIQGALADAIGIHLAFLMPIICYAYIAFYGLIGSKS